MTGVHGSPYEAGQTMIWPVALQGGDLLQVTTLELERYRLAQLVERTMPHDLDLGVGVATQHAGTCPRVGRGLDGNSGYGAFNHWCKGGCADLRIGGPHTGLSVNCEDQTSPLHPSSCYGLSPRLRTIGKDCAVLRLRQTVKELMVGIEKDSTESYPRISAVARRNGTEHRGEIDWFCVFGSSDNQCRVYRTQTEDTQGFGCELDALRES